MGLMACSQLATVHSQLAKVYLQLATRKNKCPLEERPNKDQFRVCDKQFEATEKRLRALEGRIKELDRRLGVIEGVCIKTKAKGFKLERYFEQLEARNFELHVHTAALQKEIEKLQKHKAEEFRSGNKMGGDK
jgi:chromosome segregation ATPase